MPPPDSAPTVRTFVAVLFSPPLRQRLAEAIAQVSSAAPGRTVQWVKADSIHLTLKFLGIVRANMIPNITQALTATVSGHAPFEFTALGLGCFPNMHQPRVVWAGVTEGADQLKSIQSAVEAALNPLGYLPEDRPYSPHITLGRVAREATSANIKELGKLIAAQPASQWGVDKVEAIYLMKSDLRSGGAVYTPLHRVDLTG